MNTIVAFNLAKIGDSDAKFFEALHNEFRRCGYKFILFSNPNHDRIRKFRKPFEWKISNLTTHYPDLIRPIPSTDASEAASKWTKRISMLSLQGDEHSTSELYQILENFSEYVFDTYDPVGVLSWNTLCPHSGILAEKARTRNISTYLIERAFLNDTWFLEKGGLVGHSVLAGSSFEGLLEAHDETDLADVGRSYLDTKPFRLMDRYDQPVDPAFKSIYKRNRSLSRGLIAFFPPDDLSLGFEPTDHEDRTRHVPSFNSSLDAAIALAKSSPDADVIFKPHPSFREIDLPEKIGDNLFVLNHDYRELISLSDAVATTGSGLAIVALSQGKPVIQLGRDQLTGKGICYEGIYPDDITQAAQDALGRRGLEARAHRFNVFLGYCLTSYLVSLPDSDGSFRTPATAVAEIVHDLGHSQPAASSAFTKSDALPHRFVSNNRMQMHEAMSDGRDRIAIVDFDHTMFFANSTELFLDSIRPRFLFVWLHWIVEWFTPWKTLRKRGVTRDQLKDPMLIFYATILFPWTWVMWVLRAKKNIQGLENNVLVNLIKSRPVDKIAIVSMGHPWVLKPLLRAMGLGRYKLICGNIYPTRSDIRRVGKWKACMSKIRDLRPGGPIVVTDSMADADVLSQASQGFLIDWKDEKNKADYLSSYFPFVLTSNGKYAGQNVVKRHRFEEDFPLLLIAFLSCLIPVFAPVFSDPSSLSLPQIGTIVFKTVAYVLALLCFFISFNSVYEIGYWENDFVAAQREKKPNVSPKMQRFKNYPVHIGGWVWGVVLGGIGALIMYVSGLASPVRSIVELIGLPAITTIPAMIAAWILVLIVQRIAFNIHNSIKPDSRIYSFFALHAYKLVIYAIMFPATIAGAFILVSQIFRHWINYVVYRFDGAKARTPKGNVRPFFLVSLTLIYVLMTLDLSVFNLVWALGFVFFITNMQSQQNVK